MYRRPRDPTDPADRTAPARTPSADASSRQAAPPSAGAPSASVAGRARRALGNHATGAVLQAKLTVGAVDDPLEREANHVADRVMRMPASPAPLASAIPRISAGGPTAIQRQESGPDVPGLPEDMGGISLRFREDGRVEIIGGGPKLPIVGRPGVGIRIEDGELVPIYTTDPFGLGGTYSPAEVMDLLPGGTPEEGEDVDRSMEDVQSITPGAAPSRLEGPVLTTDQLLDRLRQQTLSQGPTLRWPRPINAQTGRGGILGSRTLDGFALGDDTLTRDHMDAIAEVAPVLSGLLRFVPGGFVYVTGHADATGTPARNEAVSRARAEAVRAALVQNGIPDNRLIVLQRGASDLRVNTEQAEPRNRRVEIEFQRSSYLRLTIGAASGGAPASIGEPLEAPPSIGNDASIGAGPTGSTPPEVQRSSAGGPLARGGALPRAAASSVKAVQSDRGRPLPIAERRFFEPRFGTSFDGVRIHTGPAAQTANSVLGAQAFTVGRDVAFGAGQFRPGTRDGRHLLAHELTHVVQQESSPRRVQRQDDEDSRTTANAPTEAIGADDVIPFPARSRVALGRILPDFLMNIVRTTQPRTAAMADAIDRQVAEVETATPDQFEAVVAGPVRVPKTGGAVQTLEDIRVTLRRMRGGTFTFQVTARQQGQPSRIVLTQRTGLTAERRHEGVVLSSTSGQETTRQLQIREIDPGRIRLGVFGESIEGVPDMMRGQVFEAIEMTQLDPAQTDAEMERQVEALANAQQASRRERRQEIALGGGIGVAGGDPLGLLSTSWRIRFPTTGLLEGVGVGEDPTSVAGSLLQVPIEVQVMYAPESTMVGSVATGLDLNVPTEIPLNLRLLVLGVGGGSFEPTPGAERQPTLGMPLGVSVGTEIGVFRINLRYDALFNLLSGGTSLHALTATTGFAF